MAVMGAGSAIVWTAQSRTGDALFAGLVAFAAVGIVALAGCMRRANKNAADFFPPEVR